MTVFKDVTNKATTGSVAAIMLIATLCYLAVTGSIQGETFLAAVVGGPLVYLYGKSQGAAK